MRSRRAEREVMAETVVRGSWGRKGQGGYGPRPRSSAIHDGSNPLTRRGPQRMATSIRIDDELKARVQRLAERRQRSTHWVMREAIAQYVAREEALDSFKQEALASWKAYKETGRHLTGEEVRAWLETWGTDAEAAMPECHE